MSARIAPDSISAIAAAAAEYRQSAQGYASRYVAPVSETASAYIEAGDRPGFSPQSDALEAQAESMAPPMPVERPGSDYVRAVISGALAPRPTTAQELFARVGTSWTPPESEYRLTEKLA